VQSQHLQPASRVSDMFGGWEDETRVDALNSFHLALAPYEGFSLLVERPLGPDADPLTRIASNVVPYPPSAEDNVMRATREERPVPAGREDDGVLADENPQR
jgi:hypothetical protein